MKTLEEFKGMIKEFLLEHKNDDFSYDNYNFAAYNNENKKLILFDEYSKAKNYAVQGGQVLVIDKEKIYTYKDKNDEEFMNYIKNEVRRESFEKMNRYGL